MQLFAVLMRGRWRIPESSLWREADFLRYLAAHLSTGFGRQVSGLAVALVAAVVLRATPTEMGFLGAALTSPFLLVGLVAGVWVDRLRRRPILVATEAASAALLLWVPVAMWLDVLRMEHLYVTGFLLGTCFVFFEVAQMSYLPRLVGRERIVEGNSTLEVGGSVVQIAGPGVAGVLIQTAPIAVAVDAVSFLVSGFALLRIRAKEPPPVPQTERRPVRVEIGEGVHAVAVHPILRPLVAAAGVGNVGDGLLYGSGIYVLFATRELGIEPAALGLVLSSVGIGGLAGAALAGSVTRRLGVGRVFMLGLFLWGGSYLSIAFVNGTPTVAAVQFAAALGVVGMVNPLVAASAATLRQAVTPPRLLGRVGASMKVVSWTAVTVGSLAGGVIAEQAGFRVTAALSGILPLVGVGLLGISPVRALRALPQPA